MPFLFLESTCANVLLWEVNLSSCLTCHSSMTMSRSIHVPPHMARFHPFCGHIIFFPIPPSTLPGLCASRLAKITHSCVSQLLTFLLQTFSQGLKVSMEVKLALSVPRQRSILPNWRLVKNDRLSPTPITATPSLARDSQHLATSPSRLGSGSLKKVSDVAAPPSLWPCFQSRPK